MARMTPMQQQQDMTQRHILPPVDDCISIIVVHTAGGTKRGNGTTTGLVLVGQNRDMVVALCQ
jgi:hypothetical protein